MPASKKKKQYPESSLHKKIAQCYKTYYPNILWFHIPNGGSRTQQEAIRFRLMGVLAGVYDIFVSETTPVYPGMYMEIKAPGKTAKPDKKQDDFRRRAEARGYYCVVVNNLYDAVAELEQYMGIPKAQRLSVVAEKVLRQKPGQSRFIYIDRRERCGPKTG